MSTATKAILALAAGLALAPSLHAQDASPDSAAPKTPGGMDQGTMTRGEGMMDGGMAGMMRMMANCDRMMQGMNSRSPQDPSTPPTIPPATPGQRG